MTAARVLSPVPNPSAMPEAMAMTFFRAPATSQPITSGFVYTRKRSLARTSWIASATTVSSMAMTEAAAPPARISLARLGPVSTPHGWPGSSASSTSVMRSRVPCSRPFDRLTTGTPGGRNGASSLAASRMPCDGTPITRISAADTASSTDEVAWRLGVSSKPSR